ncbi:MAG: DUF1501 domain-containing protein [Gammaproteobacteria bacterium]
MGNRRQFLAGGAAAAGLTLAGGRTGLIAQALAAGEPDERILVVFELSGGNDGLNSVVPYGDDSYYALRPKIGIRKQDLLPLDDHFGLNPGMAGLHKLWQDGQVAIVHGCGYERPSFSHFTSMAYWHTGAPNSGDEYGWYGRLADHLAPAPRPNLLVNIDTAQSLAVKSRVHTPVVFDEPDRFQRKTLVQEREVIEAVDASPTGNAARDFLNQVSRSANEASAQVREAWASYTTPVDYGIAPSQLPKVAALINAGFPARLYYLAFRNNAFDTHVQQPNLHRRLWSYAADGVHGFIRDLERLGVADRVTVMLFSEFGRRAGENTNLGTDHGTANWMMLVGNGVKGGHYGTPPDLDHLDDTDNLVHTADFRRVYATAIDGWLRLGQADAVLKGHFEPFPVFAGA